LKINFYFGSIKYFIVLKDMKNYQARYSAVQLGPTKADLQARYSAIQLGPTKADLQARYAAVQLGPTKADLQARYMLAIN
jgi:hypothetical protein